MTTPEFTDTIRDALREPFKPEQIGKLPKIPKNKQGTEKANCPTCRGWHEKIPASLHVDYVGHAIINHRLNLAVGPGNWSYTIDQWVEGERGHLAAVVGTMTILGRTIGAEVGTPQKTGAWGDEAKTAISDFICRAAMRFGVALDLWSKQELEESAGGESNGKPAEGPSEKSPAATVPGQAGQQTAAAPAAGDPTPPAAAAHRASAGGRRAAGGEGRTGAPSATAPAPAPTSPKPASNSNSNGNGNGGGTKVEQLCVSAGVSVNSVWLKARRAGSAKDLPEHFAQIGNLDDFKALDGADFDLLSAFVADTFKPAKAAS